MKRVKFLTMMSLIVTSSIVLFTGCDDSPRMDKDKCAEVALQYMEEKYQTEFEVLDTGEAMKYVGSAGYAKVTVRQKLENSDNEYLVVVYPDGTIDEDKDGYYDSYKVVADNYMCELITRVTKKEMDNLLSDAGLTRFLSRINIKEIIEGVSLESFSANFPIIIEDDFSLTRLLDNYNINIHCYLEIPEGEFSDMLLNDISDEFQPLVTNDYISFYIVVHSEETYTEREILYKENEELYKNDRTNKIKGIMDISFYIRDEEDENEFK